MGYAQRRAAIVGVYTSEQARFMDRTGISLQLESIKGALDDAGLTPGVVDGLIPLDEAPYGRLSNAHMFWAEQLGEHPITFMDVGLASGGLAKAALAISAGLCNVAVLFWGKAGWQLGPRGTAVPDRAPRVEEFSWQLQGGYYSAWYALWAQRYMYEFKVSSEELAEVAVTHRYHATLNPDSIMGRRGPITVEDVVTSRMIADPLHLLDCALDNDGGYAIVMAAEDIARDCRKAPVWVLGGAEAAYTDASWARARRTSPRATPGWAGRCRATPTAGCCRTATAPTPPVCTRSRSSASSGASAATARFPTRGSASRWPRAWPCTVTRER